MTLLKGSIIDFATELIGSSFRVVENPQVSHASRSVIHFPRKIGHANTFQAKGSGCGCGVSWELKM